MQTVHPSLSFLHTDAGPACPGMLRGGHPDECGVILGSPDAPADALAFLADVYTDQAISEADSAHRNDLHAAYARAKELVGVAFMKLGRQVTISDAYGPAETGSTWFAIIDHAHYGSGDTAEEAVNAALENLDNSRGIATAVGGYIVAGVTSVQAAPHRDEAKALCLARRIALRPSYLDTCTNFRVPGIVDLRPGPIALTAPAAA